MTRAVCFSCGDIKFGAFVACPTCGGSPDNEDDLALSMAITDHYFDAATLESIGTGIRDGKQPDLDLATRESFLAAIRSAPMTAILLSRNSGKEEGDPARSSEKIQRRPALWQRFKDYVTGSRSTPGQ